MSETLAKKAKPAAVTIAEVVRCGDQLLIPEQMSLEQAIDTIQRQMKYEEEVIELSEAIPYTVYDGALALKKAFEQVFGFAFVEGPDGLFGKGNAREIRVPNGVNSTVAVPWGQLPIPGGNKDWIGTGYTLDKGVVVFSVNAKIRRKYEPAVRKVIDLTRKICAEESIYRGKAFKVRFRDPDGGQKVMLEPTFLDVSKLDERDVIYSRSLEEDLDINVIAPLREPALVTALGTPLKRGVLLAGKYGTGKTLQAMRVAKVAISTGWTFIYVHDASELPDAIAFAQLYGPTVIYAEDIDRAVTGDRTNAMDQILNTLDGIDSKHTPIFTILTTNHLDEINKAMLRPGRLDVVLEITPPDAEACERIIRRYAREALAPNEDLTAVGKLLDGTIPAVIREVVERAKLAWVNRTFGTTRGPIAISAADLTSAARSVLAQAKLCAVEKVTPEHPAVSFARAMADSMREQLTEQVCETINERF